jgi:hypothetical protein
VECRIQNISFSAETLWAKPLEKGDIKGAIAAATKDKYLIAPGSDAAKKRMADILSANPQDLTHPELELPVRPALPRLADSHPNPVTCWRR